MRKRNRKMVDNKLSSAARGEDHKYLFLPVLNSLWVDEVRKGCVARPNFTNEYIVVRVLQ